jgi:hypothetical protein
MESRVQELISAEVVSQAMRGILQQRAKDLEREVGFVQRSTAQLDGPAFATMTVLSWMADAEVSYSQLQQRAATLGVVVSPQAIEQRFGDGSVRLLRQLLEEAAGRVLVSEPSQQEVLARFTGVYLQDGTIISLPASMKQDWPGCGGSTPEAGVSSLRVQARLDLARGGLSGLWLQAGREHEASGAATETPLGAGSLWDVDLGYFTLGRMKQMTARGEYWQCPAKTGMVYIDQRGVSYDLQTLLETYVGEGDTLDIAVQLGTRERVAARLIAQKLPPELARQRRERSTQSVTMPTKGVQRLGRNTHTAAKAATRKRMRRKPGRARLKLLDWTIIVTNVPSTLLSVQEVVLLLRCRWQMELLWKLWKQLTHLDSWRSAKPERILTEILAKLLACLFQHWLTVLGCWQRPDRSMVKAHQVVAWMAPVMAFALAGAWPLEEVIGRCAAVMAQCCGMTVRRKHPNTFQYLNQSKLNSS